jgi:excisionase family DNA binding protein
VILLYPVKPQANPHLLTAKEAAEILRCSPGKVYELAKTKGFPAMRIGKSIRIIKPRLFEWLENQTQG